MLNPQLISTLLSRLSSVRIWRAGCDISETAFWKPYCFKNSTLLNYVCFTSLSFLELSFKEIFQTNASSNKIMMARPPKPWQIRLKKISKVSKQSIYLLLESGPSKSREIIFRMKARKKNTVKLCTGEKWKNCIDCISEIGKLYSQPEISTYQQKYILQII